jgi:hypothetical protein
MASDDLGARNPAASVESSCIRGIRRSRIPLLQRDSTAPTP